MNVGLRFSLFSIAFLVAGFGAGPARSQPCTIPAVAPTTPTSDFQLDADGTAVHLPAGLVWMRCTLGQAWTVATCTGAARPITAWSAALQVAADVNSGADDADNDGAPGFAGATDWRLPSVRELATIHEACRINPALNVQAFPDGPIAAGYWTSTTVDSNAVAAWGHGTARGGASFLLKSDGIPRFVRLVRGGGLGGHRLLGRLFANGFE